MTRLILIVVLFVISLLTVLKAQAYYLWLLAIAVTEFPLVFAGITLVLLFAGFFAQKHQLAGTVTGIVALGLFLSPVLRSYLISRDLGQNLDTAFGTSQADSRIFSLGKLFRLSYKDPVASRPITYASYGDLSLSLDFYPSEMAGNRPCVIVVHGGSWSSGDSKQLPELNSYLAKAGYHAAALNYRLAPAWQSPAPVEDVKRAIDYLRKHAEELHIDPHHFVLLGRSAGAQIALLAAYTLHDGDVKGVIDFYGPADMVWGYSIPSNPLIMDSRSVMDAYLGGSYSAIPEKYAASSPLLFVDKTSVPTLIIHGSNDVLVSDEHSRRLNLKLQQNGVKHYWLALPWATHGFDYNLNGPGGQLATYAVERFLGSLTPTPLQGRGAFFKDAE